MIRKIGLIVAFVAICLCVDYTDLALPLEIGMADATEKALARTLCGLNLSPELVCSIAPACSGLRTIVACGLLATLLGAWRILPLALAGGAYLNLLRVLVIEVATRLSPEVGHLLHDFALPLIITPVAWGVCCLWGKVSRLQVALIYTLAAQLALLLLYGPRYL